MNYEDVGFLICGVVFLVFAYLIFVKTDKVKEFYNKRPYNAFSAFRKKVFMSDKDYDLYLKFIGALILFGGILSIATAVLSMLNV